MYVTEFSFCPANIKRQCSTLVALVINKIERRLESFVEIALDGLWAYLQSARTQYTPIKSQVLAFL